MAGQTTFFKRYLWIFAIIAAILLALTAFTSNSPPDPSKAQTGDKGEPPKEFTSAMEKRAEDAFAKGITIDDPENDWYRFPEGSRQWDKPDNPNPYPLSYTDLKQVKLGADEEYLYVKFVFYGNFPGKMPSYNGDDLFSTGAKIEQLSYATKEGKTDSAETGSAITYVQFTGAEKTEGHIPLGRPSTGQLAMISPQGTDEKSETIYRTKNGAGFVSGGSGTDYLMSAFPLAEFGISYGQEINFSVSVESGSNLWHHESVDFLLNRNNSKSGAKIRYALGGNRYELAPNEEDTAKNK